MHKYRARDAAAILGVGVSTLYRLVDRFGKKRRALNPLQLSQDENGFFLTRDGLVRLAELAKKKVNFDVRATSSPITENAVRIQSTEVRTSENQVRTFDIKDDSGIGDALAVLSSSLDLLRSQLAEKDRLIHELTLQMRNAERRHDAQIQRLTRQIQEIAREQENQPTLQASRAQSIEAVEAPSVSLLRRQNLPEPVTTPEPKVLSRLRDGLLDLLRSE